MTMRIGRRYFLHGLELRPTTYESDLSEGTILVKQSSTTLSGIIKSISVSSSVITFSDTTKLSVGDTFTSSSFSGTATISEISGYDVTFDKIIPFIVGDSISCVFDIKILKTQLQNNLRQVITDTQFQSVINKIFGISIESNTTGSGSEVTLTAPTAGGILLKNTGLSSIANISSTGVKNGQQLTIFNRTGNYLGIIDSSSTKGSASDRILTGTGASISMSPDSSLNLTYDSDISRWQIVGGSGGGGGGLTFQASQPPSPIGPFGVLTPIYHDGVGWKKAIANGLDPNTLATYIVVEASETSFTAAKFGVFPIENHGKTIGEFYYVSADNYGETTSTEPTTGYSNPVFYVEDANKIHALVHRPTSLQKSSSFADNSFEIYDATDNTKRVKIDADGTAGTATTLKSTQTQDRVLTLPDITDTIVTKNTIDTLTNKTLSDSTTSLADVTDPTKKLKFDVGGTTNTATTITSAQTANRTLALPDNNGTLVSTGDVGTVTSTMIADGTIVDADINANAAIARSKIAVGSAYRLVTNGADGKLIDAAAITPARALISDANGIPTASVVTSSELAKLSGISTTQNTVVGTSSTGALIDIPGFTYNSGAIVISNAKHLEEQAATDAVTTGTATVMTLGNSGVLRLTNASLVSLSGISGGADGRKLVIINRTGRSVIFLNESTLSATASNRIITGTAADLSIASNSAVVLVYDATTLRWQVIGGSASGGGSTGANTSLSNLVGPTAVNTSLLPNPNSGVSLGTIDTGWDAIYAGMYRSHNKAKTITITTTTGNYNITVSSTTGIIPGVSRILNTTAFPNMPEGVLVTAVSGTTVTVDSSVATVVAVTNSSSKILSPLDMRSLPETVAGTQSAPVVIKSGTTNGALTGSVTIASEGSSGPTGDILLSSGISTADKSGSVSIVAGNAPSTAGSINIIAGSATDMAGLNQSGDVIIKSGQNLFSGGGNVKLTSYGSLILNPSGGTVVKDFDSFQIYETVSTAGLPANISTFANHSISINPTLFSCMKIDYVLQDSVTGDVRFGTLHIAAKSTSVFSINDTYTETAKIGTGIEFGLAYNAGINAISLQYKGTTNLVNCKFNITKM